MSRAGSTKQGLGYFVVNGALGFHGGIGGPSETTPWTELLERIKNVTTPDNTRGYGFSRIHNNDEMSQRWVTIKESRDFDRIPVVWKNKQDWWTLHEVRTEIALTRQEIKAKAMAAEEIAKDSGHKQSTARPKLTNVSTERSMTHQTASNVEQQTASTSSANLHTGTYQKTNLKEIQQRSLTDDTIGVSMEGNMIHTRNEKEDITQYITVTRHGRILGQKDKASADGRILGQKDKASADETETICEGCGLGEKDHKGPAAKLSWIGCDCCGRWFVKSCLGRNQGVPKINSYFKCSVCVQVQRKMETVVNEWDQVTADLAFLRKKALEKTNQNSSQEEELKKENIRLKKDMSSTENQNRERMRNADMVITTLKDDISTLETERSLNEDKLDTLQAAYDKIIAEKLAQDVETQEHVARNKRLAESIEEHVKRIRQQERSLPHSNVTKDGQITIKAGVTQNKTAERADHLYSTHNIESLKRRDQTPPNPPTPRKSRRTGQNENTLTFIGDSLIKALAEDKGLDITGYNRGWNTQILRGGKTTYIKKTTEQTDLRQSKWTIICTGTNDISDINHRHETEDIHQNIIVPLREITEKVKQQHSRPVIVIPPPRRDVQENTYKTAVQMIKEKARDWGIKTFDMREEGETSHEFRRRLRPDGVHIDNGHFRHILARLLGSLGENTHLEPQDKQWDLNFFFPGQCWTCGRQHPKKEKCEAFSTCQRCSSATHSEKVCLSRFQACKKCGVRGHAQAVCNGWR